MENTEEPEEKKGKWTKNDDEDCFREFMWKKILGGGVTYEEGMKKQPDSTVREPSQCWNT